jgi:hypothetical protein
VARTGSIDGPTPGARVSDHPVAGPPRYADEVLRRLRDVPRSERESIGTELVQHLRESGCETYRQCIDRFGAPGAYADEMRTGLELPPYRRSRRPWLVVAGTAAVLVIAAGAWRTTRPEPLPEGFTALQSYATAVMGDDAKSVAGTLQIVVDSGEGDARIAVVLANTSDSAIEVDMIGPPMVRWGGEGSVTIGGQADVPLRRGELDLSSIWTPTVRIEPVADQTGMAVDEHELTGEPFAPFRWEPGDAYLISISGPVAACSPELAPIDGGGFSITVDYRIGDAGFSQGVAGVGLDTSRCAVS